MIAKLVLLGVMQITSYRPVPEQTKPECTNRNHCRTSIGENFSEIGIAASQDLLKSGRVHYNDCVYIEGYGFHVIDDTMANRITGAFDLPVYTRLEEKKIGVRHLKVWLIERPQEDTK